MEVDNRFCQDIPIHIKSHLSPLNYECEFDSNALATKSQIQTLSEEKAAHEGFMLMRTRQQEDERHQFRKAWKRRRSMETAMTTIEDCKVTKSDTNRFIKLRRLQKYGQLTSTLATAESPALACQG